MLLARRGVDVSEDVLQTGDIRRREFRSAETRDVLLQVIGIARAGQNDVCTWLVSAEPVRGVGDAECASLVNEEIECVVRIA